MSEDEQRKDSMATQEAPRQEEVPTVTERRPWAAPKLVILQGADTANVNSFGGDGFSFPPLTRS